MRRARYRHRPFGSSSRRTESSFSTGPLEEILNKIMDLVSREMPFERGLLMLFKNGELVPQVIRVPAEQAGSPVSLSRTIVDRVVERKESVLTFDALSDDRFKAGESVQLQCLRSVMCVPLWNQREVIGLIYIDIRDKPAQFTEQDLLVLTHLAAVAAVKIEQQILFERAVAARFMEEELRKAAEIQRHLLPAEAPAVAGYKLCGTSIPCQSVGGDSYDFLQLEGGRTGIVLADVAGRGLSAALLMGVFQASMRALLCLDLPPDDAAARLNRLLYPQMPLSRFVTLFYGILNPNRHTLTYVNAGHDPPFVFRDGVVVEELPASEKPLGLLDEDIRYEACTISLRPGDVLLCYSDGATDAGNPAGEIFGKERLIEATGALQDRSPDAIIRRLEAEICRFGADSPQDDDITFLVLKREP
ncbi:MAG: PP2C family protein-serine/threonine phosphatase [Acidobacteriota bacterium]